MQITKDLIKRGFYFCLSALIIYFVGKAPIMYLLTSILGINYIISGALAGAFVTILQFIPTEFWIFKGKKKKMVVL